MEEMREHFEKNEDDIETAFVDVVIKLNVLKKVINHTNYIENLIGYLKKVPPSKELTGEIERLEMICCSKKNATKKEELLKKMNVLRDLIDKKGLREWAEWY